MAEMNPCLAGAIGATRLARMDQAISPGRHVAQVIARVPLLRYSTLRIPNSRICRAANGGRIT